MCGFQNKNGSRYASVLKQFLKPVFYLLDSFEFVIFAFAERNQIVDHFSDRF